MRGQNSQVRLQYLEIKKSRQGSMQHQPRGIKAGGTFQVLLFFILFWIDLCILKEKKNVSRIHICTDGYLKIE